MKLISLFLVLNVILCYTGLDVGVSYSSTLPNITNCHKNQRDEISSSESIKNSYKNNDATQHGMFKCCYEALPNAPHGHDFDLKQIVLHSLAVNITTLDSNKLFSFLLSPRIKEHHPPDLFLVNSSFLL
jgi:hypothetical protein